MKLPGTVRLFFPDMDVLGFFPGLLAAFRVIRVIIGIDGISDISIEIEIDYLDIFQAEDIPLAGFYNPRNIGPALYQVPAGRHHDGGIVEQPDAGVVVAGLDSLVEGMVAISLSRSPVVSSFWVQEDKESKAKRNKTR
jgi:hypothetical protein